MVSARINDAALIAIGADRSVLRATTDATVVAAGGGPDSGLDEPAVWAVPEGDPEEPKAFEFVERPRVEPEIYISRPELGRDPAETPADGGRRLG